MALFLRQFWALVWKNWIVLAKHPWLNVLRCFVLPIAYGMFLAYAQLFLDKPNNFGLGSTVLVRNLSDAYDPSLALIWADGTNGTGTPSAEDIMSKVTRGFSLSQLASVRKVDSPDDISPSCPENYNGYSECFGAVEFQSLPGLPTQASGSGTNVTTAFNYTLRLDQGLFYINVAKHTSDYEKRVIPLQWAIDSAIIELTTGVQPPTPLEWPYTEETNSEQNTEIRISYVNLLRTLLVIALFVCYIGIAYQLPGSFMGERANQLTSHMKAMGLKDSARILSWHISISLAYLPAWIIVSVVWRYRIFATTNVGLIIGLHLLLGLSLASWSFFVAMPFGKSPQLAAVVTTFCGIVCSILGLIFEGSTGGAFVFSLAFPPAFYVIAIRAISGFEDSRIPTSVLQGDPDSGFIILPMLIAAIIDIFMWPYFAVLLERRLYDARNTTSKRSWWACCRREKQAVEEDKIVIPPDVAMSIRNLGKDFKAGRKGVITAVSDLTLNIPKYGIFVLLGSNGAGKSTVMSILAGLLGRTRGSVTFEGGHAQAPRGAIGLVPQKNVLFPELTCAQTLRVWRAVKTQDGAPEDEDVEQLLRDCDLGKKVHYNASALSGGQKRKLQLAIGLVGGSKILLVDECTSGVDPLSRRALWRTLTSVRHERTILFTTHFLDEADLLGDTIAVLKAPGTLVAEGTPVSLKSTYGEGYTVQVSFNSAEVVDKSEGGELLDRIRELAPLTYTSSSAPLDASYHLKSKDTTVVQRVLELVEKEREVLNIASYSVLGTSIEDIFLGLMHDDTKGKVVELEKVESMPSLPTTPPTLELTDGRRRSPIGQALTIFHKRVLVLRRSWLSPLLAVGVAVLASCVPLFFISGRAQTCVTPLQQLFPESIFLPTSAIGSFLQAQAEGFTSGLPILTYPPGILSTLGPSFAEVPVQNITDSTTLTDIVYADYMNLTVGGISADVQSGSVMYAWEASPPGSNGLVMQNLASNIVLKMALNATGHAADGPVIISPSTEYFPAIAAGSLVALKWIAFFGAGMAVFPAFFSLYVSKERRSAVQAMQLSNGLSNPIGLWLGHLLFDSIFCVIAATIMTIVYAAASNQFNGLGFLWFILVQYGIVGALFSYCISLMVASPLAAFAVSAGYQVIIFVLYLAAYLLTLTYAKTTDTNKDLNIIHFTMSIVAPVVSVLRGALVSINQFSLLCDGSTPVTTKSMGEITRFGGPILYLFVYGFVLFGILVWVDSGSIFPRRTVSRKSSVVPTSADASAPGRVGRHDVDDEAAAVATSDDVLRVLNVVKAYGSKRVVDDVSFGVARNTIFALLGPNGAGKTTTFNIIRNEVLPDEGDVVISGTSVVHHPRTARLSLGVCPQFTAIDSEMTVEEHLLIYGRLKGLHRGEEVRRNVQSLMRATSLDMYADRLASKLSGGNQRKLSLAIALIGNPSVVLIDEFSTGIDAKMKRDMWGTLRNVAVGKAIVITTHSMEEASALANKVGILAKRMLAVGSTNSLAERYATYEVHFSTRSREDVVRAQELMARIPGSRMADDVATRFEVPLGNGLSLAQLFAVLAEHGTFAEYTVERATLESVFLKVIRENDVLEEDREIVRRRWRYCC
ncbi:P-loop containing nucleoside triphosphate hydrolase protein [Amylocystis lapponica]|nr:P-loop containing nucleoside triphosphate hydrolase protein [Amylocystis lapponica]